MKSSCLFYMEEKGNVGFCFLFSSLVFLQFYYAIGAVARPTQNLTHGFVSLPLNDSNFDIQRPYDLQVSERYSFENGVHKLWVLSTDNPLSPMSPTAPRTEIRIRGYDYFSGVWQFEGHTYISGGTSGVCIMQVFGSNNKASTLMLRVYNGALMYYSSKLIVDDIYDKWIQVNAIHDVNTRQVTVFIDGALKLTVNDRGGESRYFKCGVYTQNYSSYFMESRWKGIKILKLSY